MEEAALQRDHQECNTAREQEYPEGTQADTGRTRQQVHKEKTPAQPEVKPRALLALMLVPNVFSLSTHSCSPALHNFFFRQCIISDKISGTFSENITSALLLPCINHANVRK